MIGDKRLSYRFRKALEVTPEIAALIFNGTYDPESDGFINENNDRVKNKKGNFTKFRNFHSNTRPMQIYLDSENNDSENTSLNKLLKVIEKHC